MPQTVRVLVLLLVSVVLSACVAEGVRNDKKNQDQIASNRLELGYRYLADGNREAARKQFMDVVKLDSGLGDAYLGVARVHEANLEINEADSFYRKAVGKRSLDSASAIRLAYGHFLWSQKKYKDAAKQFDAAGKDFDFRDRSQGIYWLGRCQAVLGDVAKARASFQYAINVRPSFGEPYMELAELAFAERDYINAEQHYEKFTQNAKQNPRSLWLGIRLHRVLGHDDKVASYALALKNLHGSSDEYLEYQRLMGQ